MAGANPLISTGAVPSKRIKPRPLSRHHCPGCPAEPWPEALSGSPAGSVAATPASAREGARLTPGEPLAARPPPLQPPPPPLGLGVGADRWLRQRPQGQGPARRRRLGALLPRGQSQESLPASRSLRSPPPCPPACLWLWWEGGGVGGDGSARRQGASGWAGGRRRPGGRASGRLRAAGAAGGGGRVAVAVRPEAGLGGGGERLPSASRPPLWTST